LEYKVRISEKLNEALQKTCEIYKATPEEVIEEAIRRVYGAPKKWLFFDGRKFAIPEECFVIFALPTHQHKKFVDWLDAGDEVKTLPLPGNEIILLNETKLKQTREL